MIEGIKDSKLRDILDNAVSCRDGKDGEIRDHGTASQQATTVYDALVSDNV